MLAEKIQTFREHLGTAVRDYKRVASLFPSSRYTAASVGKRLPQPSRALIEYGPGTGIITRELLRRLSADGRLMAVEVNARFVPMLERLGDSRLEVRRQNVLEALPGVSEAFPQGVDAVISGIPFSLIPAPERWAIVSATRDVLRPGGCFIAYQNSRLLVRLFEQCFDSVECHFEPRNVFPYFIIVGRVAGPE